MLSEQSNKDPPLSWRRTDRFLAQNGKDEPNPRAARAWQEKTIKKRNVKVDCIFVNNDWLVLNRPRPEQFISARWTWRIKLKL
jgi:hypothetical protein